MASIGGSSAARRGIAELSQAFARMGRPSSARCVLACVLVVWVCVYS